MERAKDLQIRWRIREKIMNIPEVDRISDNDEYIDLTSALSIFNSIAKEMFNFMNRDYSSHKEDAVVDRLLLDRGLQSSIRLNPGH